MELEKQKNGDFVQSGCNETDHIRQTPSCTVWTKYIEGETSFFKKGKMSLLKILHTVYKDESRDVMKNRFIVQEDGDMW